MLFDPDARVFVLSNWQKIQLLWQIFSSNLICFIPFSQLWLGLIDCMILMKEYVSLTTAAMKMGKRHFYSSSKQFRVYGIFKKLQIDDDKGGPSNTTIL